MRSDRVDTPFGWTYVGPPRWATCVQDAIAFVAATDIRVRGIRCRQGRPVGTERGVDDVATDGGLPHPDPQGSRASGGAGQSDSDPQRGRAGRGAPRPQGGQDPLGRIASGRVHLVDRVQVEWGDWSIVEATLRMFRFARTGLERLMVRRGIGEHWPWRTWRMGTDLASRGVDAYLPAQILPPRLHFGSRDLDGNRSLARCVHRWFRFRRPQSDLAHRAVSGLSKISLRTHPR